MTGHDHDGVYNADDPNQPSVATQHKDPLPADIEEDISSRENAVLDAKTAVQNREQSAMKREDVMSIRENAADVRDDAAYVREVEIRAAEKVQEMTDRQMIMLQQANAHLVIATIEAHKMTEQIKSAKQELDYLAHHDVLTGLPNRNVLNDRLNQTIMFARRHDWQFAVIFMDLDQFKHINDSLGHAVGDQLLKSVAQRLVECVRQSDTISRQGGDEFVLLLPYIQRGEDAAISAQKTLAALAQPHRIDQHELYISMSIGISIYPGDGQDAETLIKNADIAMYYAKENGRNNYKFFEQSMNDRAVQRQATEASLRYALERQEFVLYYQPKINLNNRAIVGVEALIRWRHPERGLLLPAQFVPIAEDCGLILPIGRWVLREVCSQAHAWLQAGLPPVTIAINTSALEFRAKDFIENIRTTLEGASLDPRYLEIELTESILMRDAESTNTVLSALADLNIKLAIDDFGTGYSSLSYLRQFPIDTLKIDQSFVNRMTSNADDATIVKAVISMGKSLRQRIIAEGVETPEQYDFLLAQDCDEGQGYYFGHPMVAKEMADLLQTGVSFSFPN